MPGLKPKTSARRNANRARCQFAGCDKFAQTRGLCKAHGGGSRCRDPDCNKLAQSRGLCIAHGGGRRCQFDGCAKLAQSKGYCISHGGGRRCTHPGCEKFSQVKGRCKSHSKLLAQSPPSSPLSVSGAFGMSPSTSSPSSAKLSIGFLVNPTTTTATLPSVMALDHSDDARRQELWRPQPPALTLPSRFPASQPIEHGRSLLSFLHPTEHAMQARPVVLPPLALFH